MLGLSMRGEAFLRRGTNPNWISPPRLTDLDQVVEQRPLSTEQILHPDKYWTGRRRDEPTPMQLEAQDLRVARAVLDAIEAEHSVEPDDRREGLEVGPEAAQLSEALPVEANP